MSDVIFFFFFVAAPSRPPVPTTAPPQAPTQVHNGPSIQEEIRYGTISVF